MTARTRHVVTVLVVVVVVLVAAVVLSTPWDQELIPQRGPVSTHTMDPVAYEVPSRPMDDCNRKCIRRHKMDEAHFSRHRGKIRSHRIARPVGRGTVRILCRTERGHLNMTDGLVTLAYANGSIRRCWNPSTNKILGNAYPPKYRPSIGHDCGVTDWGSATMWHCSDQGTLVRETDSINCSGGECWEYMFRRWVFEWERDLWFVHQHMGCMIQITANGLGDGYFGSC